MTRGVYITFVLIVVWVHWSMFVSLGQSGDLPINPLAPSRIIRGLVFSALLFGLSIARCSDAGGRGKFVAYLMFSYWILQPVFLLSLYLLFLPPAKKPAEIPL